MAVVKWLCTQYFQFEQCETEFGLVNVPHDLWDKYNKMTGIDIMSSLSCHSLSSVQFFMFIV